MSATTTTTAAAAAAVASSSSATAVPNNVSIVGASNERQTHHQKHRQHQFHQRKSCIHTSSSSSSLKDQENGCAAVTTTTTTSNIGAGIATTTRNFNSSAVTAAPAEAAASVEAAAEMKDEYGEMTADGDTFVVDEFVLENGVVLPNAQLRYQTYGELNDAKDNVIVVCHALTGNASLHSWWGGLLGDGLAFDTSQYLIVCCNILGSCYGSTNPRSLKDDGTEYGLDFPDVSVQDTVRLQLLLLKDELGAKSIHSVIGGSFGGMQAMEFAVQGGRTGGDFCQDDGTSSVVGSFYL
jgi:alpha/beta hydrolase fold